MCDKVDCARKAQTHDRLANHACELPIENVVTHKLKAMTKQIIYPTHATDGRYLDQSNRVTSDVIELIIITH
jgi:hypothetical protein